MTLVASGNTWNPCLQILRRRGYQLAALREKDDLSWTATRGSDSFLASSPLELLAVVQLAEELGPDWNRQKPNLIEELITRAVRVTPDTSDDGLKGA
jgi:hypothetical protein